MSGGNVNTTEQPAPGERTPFPLFLFSLCSLFVLCSSPLLTAQHPSTPPVSTPPLVPPLPDPTPSSPAPRRPWRRFPLPASWDRSQTAVHGWKRVTLPAVMSCCSLPAQPPALRKLGYCSIIAAHTLLLSNCSSLSADNLCVARRVFRTTPYLHVIVLGYRRHSSVVCIIVLCCLHHSSMLSAS